MAGEPDGVIATLNTLIEACKDREEGYRTAAEAAHNPDLKTMLQTYARQSAGYGDELRAAVSRLGGEPAQAGSLAGWVARGWQQLKTAVAGGDDRAVIEGCGGGECAARADYESALAAPLPDEVRVVVERQYAGVKEGCDRLHALALAATGQA